MMMISYRGKRDKLRAMGKMLQSINIIHLFHNTHKT